MALNEQGQRLAMKTWNATNYGAQMRHMAKAGLNPSLMYGMKGGGGATTSAGSGGSAGMAHGGQSNLGMINPNIELEGELLKSQKAKIDAEAKNIRDSNPNISKEGNVLDQTYKQLIETTKNEKVKRSLIRAEASAQKIENWVSYNSRYLTLKQLYYESEKVAQESRSAKANADVDEGSVDSLINTNKSNAELVAANVVLTNAKTGLTDAQTKQVTESIIQKWHEINQGWTNLSQGEQQIRINEYAEEWKANNPNMSQVKGKVLHEVFEALDEVMGIFGGESWHENDRGVDFKNE